MDLLSERDRFIIGRVKGVSYVYDQSLYSKFKDAKAKFFQTLTKDYNKKFEENIDEAAMQAKWKKIRDVFTAAERMIANNEKLGSRHQGTYNVCYEFLHENTNKLKTPQNLSTKCDSLNKAKKYQSGTRLHPYARPGDDGIGSTSVYPANVEPGQTSESPALTIVQIHRTPSSLQPILSSSSSLSTTQQIIQPPPQSSSSNGNSQPLQQQHSQSYSEPSTSKQSEQQQQQQQQQQDMSLVTEPSAPTPGSQQQLNEDQQFGHPEESMSTVPSRSNSPLARVQNYDLIEVVEEAENIPSVETEMSSLEFSLQKVLKQLEALIDQSTAYAQARSRAMMVCQLIDGFPRESQPTALRVVFEILKKYKNN